MTDHPLLQEYKELISDRTLTTEDYFSRQKDILKRGLALLKESQHKDVDHVVGSIALFEGDKYGIPVKSALGHLNRGYKNGNPDAGLLLSHALRGVMPQVPDEFMNKDKSLSILNDLAGAGFAKAYYDLSSYYLDMIMHTIDGGGHAPIEWFDLTVENATKAADANFIGGYTMLGSLYNHGFGEEIVQNPKEAVMYYQKAIETFSGEQDEEFLLGDAKNNLGCAYYDGFGTARDRKKGLGLIREAADLGNLMAQDWLAQNHAFLVKEGMLGDEEEILYEEFFDDLDFPENEPAPTTAEAPASAKDARTRH